MLVDVSPLETYFKDKESEKATKQGKAPVPPAYTSQNQSYDPEPSQNPSKNVQNPKVVQKEVSRIKSKVSEKREEAEQMKK